MLGRFSSARVNPILSLLHSSISPPPPLRFRTITTPRMPRNVCVATTSLPDSGLEKVLCKEFNNLRNENERSNVIIKIFTQDAKNASNLKILGDFKDLTPENVHYLYKIVTQNLVLGDTNTTDILAQCMWREMEDYILTTQKSHNTIKIMMVDTKLIRKEGTTMTSVMIPLDEPTIPIEISFGFHFSYIITK